jgi:hypothetical protein
VSQSSLDSYRFAVTTGLLKSWDTRCFKYLQIMGEKTWKECQADLEQVYGKRIVDSNINSAFSRLVKANNDTLLGNQNLLQKL